MKVLLTTLNAKYIHKNLALRWLYQAAYDKSNVVLQEYTIKEDIHTIVNKILAGTYDVIGFSVYIWNLEETVEIIAQLRQKGFLGTIIVGGPEVSFSSWNLLDQGIDAICVGEGEESFWEYVSMLEQKQSYEIVGIYTKTHPNKTYRKVELSFLESLENPYFMEMDEKDMQKRYLYFETSRGCPYRCGYCLSSCDPFVRMFSEQYVFQLLNQLKTSNVRQVKLLDRTFNCNPQRALRILSYMNEHCVNQIFQFEVVAETLSEELLNYFETKADKRRFRLEIGVQSFHKPTLDAVGRIQNKERLLEVLQRLQKADITMHVDLIAGLPYEDKKTFQHSFDTLFSIGSKEVQLGILKLLKGTRLQKESDKYGFQQEQHTPYTLLSSHWLTEQELDEISWTAEAVEKFWNSGRCRYTILTLLNLHEKSAFALFHKLGACLKKLHHPYAMQHLFQCFYEAYPEVEAPLLRAILYMDYYGLFKQRPPVFGQGSLDEQTRKALQNFLLEQEFTKEDIYHYTTFTYGYDAGNIVYQVIVYNKRQQLPKRYLINKSMTSIKEI